MKIGSLFSGIGGLELGLERAGLGSVAWQVEIDPFARGVLARHWPDATRYEDIQEVDFAAVEPVDVLCGGFPCQDVSDAGKRAGISGERSGLFREALRAASLVRPRILLLENVAALLHRGMGTVLGALAESGLDCEWDCIPARAVGAAHRRDRVFIIAHSERPRLEGQGVERFFSAAPVGRAVWGPGLSSAGTVRARDGIPNYVDRIRALGNAVVPQVAEHVGRLIANRLTLVPSQDGGENQ